MATITSSDLRVGVRPGRAGPPIIPTRIDRLVRADDQLHLTIEFLNLDVDPATNTLVRVDRTEAFTGVRLVFGSQHTVEDTISTPDATSIAGFAHRTARDSRLVFELAEGTPYVMKKILDLAARALLLDDRAVPGSKSNAAREAPATSRRRRRDRRPSGAIDAAETEPATDVSALEVVDSLVFSPDRDGRFTTELGPITRDDVTELWRARLESSADGDPATRPVVRAIWSRPGDPPFDRPLAEDKRNLIVHATVTDPGEPIQVDRLWLTSQGAFLDLTGEWVDGDLAGYLHRATAGRDLHVEVIERGYLAPFGPAATITQVSDRQFRVDDGGGITAVLVQDDYLAVAGATVAYPAPHMPHDGRTVPFPEVTVTDTGTGPVGKAAVTLADGTVISQSNAWIVTRDGVDAVVTYSAKDRTGRSGITFSAPAVFVVDSHSYTVQDEVNGVTTPLGNLAAYFRESPLEVDFGGQPVGWADPHPRGRAGSLRSTSSIRFVMDRPVLDAGDVPSDVKAELEAARRPAFYPSVEGAAVIDEATASLIGSTGEAVDVVYADVWLQHENGPENPGLAFHTIPTGTSLERQGSGSGLVRPALAVTTFGQVLGAGTELTTTPSLVGGDNPIVDWDPEEALGETAKLFGSILLTSIVEKVNVALDQLEGEKGMPRFEVLQEEDGIFYLMSWEPKLKSFPAGDTPVFVVSDDLEDAGLPNPFGEKASTASLSLGQLVPFDGSAAGTEFELKLENVAVQLPPAVPAIAMLFNSVRYHEPVGGTAKLETDIAEWMFINVLEFLEPVRRIVVTLLDLGDIEIGPDGVKADVEVPVPDLSFGVVGVAGLDVGLALDLPNDDPAKIGFNLSRREDPFRITVMGFGGTGSFELEMVADDIVLLHGSMAATFEISVSLFIASASLSASLGIDLLYKQDEGVTLSAYVELKANASVLGLVNITGKVLLALSYSFDSKLLKGTAKISAEVDSLFGKSETTWKETVEVALGSDDSARRSALLAGPSAETDAAFVATSFVDRFTESQWTTYCAAFS
ncbi:MAG: hypothetical protein ACRD0A_10100 [Acidimicrobiales bacterium]